jgi:class 3 adenylate cyclase
MSFTEELAEVVDDIFKTQWKTRDGDAVPEAEDVRLGNDAVLLDGTVLYADLADSTKLVNNFPNWYAAEIYKSYLVCACKIIRNNGGEITAFDGDRVMAVYIGNSKNTAAVRSALQLAYVVQDVINPKLEANYQNTNYRVTQSVGIDTSKLFVAKTGIRGANDLVWVGRAANYAAKLATLREPGYSSFVTADVFESMHESVKFGGPHNQLMWESRVWAKINIGLYRSTWRWSPT